MYGKDEERVTETTSSSSLHLDPLLILPSVQKLSTTVFKG